MNAAQIRSWICNTSPSQQGCLKRQHSCLAEAELTPVVPSPKRLRQPLNERHLNSMSDFPRQRKRKALPVEDELLQVVPGGEEEVDDDVEHAAHVEDDTPRPTTLYSRGMVRPPISPTKRHSIVSHPSHASSLGAFSDALALVSPSVSHSTARSRKETSPVRNPSDLLLAMRPVVFNTNEPVPDDVKQLVADLFSVRKEIGIMPDAIEERVRQCIPTHEFDERWFNKSSVQDAEDVNLDWTSVTDFVRMTQQHRENGAAEAAWNEDIHRPLLRRALQRLPYVRSYNVTSARPCAAFASSDLGGVQQGVKLVDYTINLEPKTLDVDAQIKSVVSRQAKDVRTITQTMHAPVRFKPAAISIETKSEAGDDITARTQLGQWAAMHFARLRTLRPDKALPVHPLIEMSPSGLSIHFAVDKPEQHRIVIIPAVTLGPMQTLVDFYRALACIRLLGKWADTIYRTQLMAILI